MDVNNYIRNNIRAPNRYVRFVTLSLIVALLGGGVVLLPQKLLPLSDILRVIIVGPILWYSWLNLGYLCIDVNHLRCSRLPINVLVPEIHHWEILFNLRNPTPWDATLFACTIVENKLIEGNRLLIEKLDVVNKPTEVRRNGNRMFSSQFQCERHVGPCNSTVKLVVEIDYTIGGGIRRRDTYVCAAQIGDKNV